MKVKRIDSYRDGGTLIVVFDSGDERFIDKRIGTATPGALYDHYPEAGSEPLPGDHSMLTALACALHEYKGLYQRERQAQRGGLVTIEEVQAHRKADKIR